MKERFLKKAKEEVNSIHQKMKDAYFVTINNLAASVTEEDLVTLFSSHGPVIRADISKAEKRASVLMEFHEDAKRAAADFDDEVLDGLVIQCTLEAFR